MTQPREGQNSPDLERRATRAVLDRSVLGSKYTLADNGWMFGEHRNPSQWMRFANALPTECSCFNPLHRQQVMMPSSPI